MSATWTNENLNDYLDDRLSSTERAELETVLQQDMRAADALHEMQQVRDQLRSAPRFQLPANFAASVVAGLAANADSGPQPGTRPESATGQSRQRAALSQFWASGSWRSAAATIATLAATLLLVVFAGPWPASTEPNARVANPEVADGQRANEGEGGGGIKLDRAGAVLTEQAAADDEFSRAPDFASGEISPPGDSISDAVIRRTPGQGESSGGVESDSEIVAPGTRSNLPGNRESSSDPAAAAPASQPDLARNQPARSSGGGDNPLADMPNADARDAVETADTVETAGAMESADANRSSDERWAGGADRQRRGAGRTALPAPSSPIETESPLEKNSMTAESHKEISGRHEYYEILQVTTSWANLKQVEQFLQSPDHSPLSVARRGEDLQFLKQLSDEGQDSGDGSDDSGEQEEVRASKLDNRITSNSQVVEVVATPGQMEVLLEKLGGQNMVMKEPAARFQFTEKFDDDMQSLDPQSGGWGGGGLGGGEQTEGKSEQRNPAGADSDAGAADGLAMPGVGAEVAADDLAASRKKIIWQQLLPKGQTASQTAETGKLRKDDVDDNDDARYRRFEQSQPVAGQAGALAGPAPQFRYLLILNIDDSAVAPPAPRPAGDQ